MKQKSTEVQENQVQRHRCAYETVGAGDVSARVYKVLDGNSSWTYQFAISRLAGSRAKMLRPRDVLALPKLAQVLAATLVDDGWISDGLRRELARLAERLDVFLDE